MVIPAGDPRVQPAGAIYERMVAIGAIEPGEPYKADAPAPDA